MAGYEPGKKVRDAPFFYGRITREESDSILQSHSCSEGLYLLRESITPVGNYVLSICHNSNVHHYSIEKQVDGTYHIPDGKNFKDPLDLIDYHKKYLDGFLTKPTAPCNRTSQSMVLKYRGVTFQDLEQKLAGKADALKLKGKEREKALNKNRDHLISLVTKDLHKEQPWFHGFIEREEAHERILAESPEDGKFLVREKKDKRKGQSCFALTLSFLGEAKHYMIEKDRSDHYSINDGPKFDNLMLLVDHYYNKTDGLICKLRTPSCYPGYDKQKLSAFHNLPHIENAARPKRTSHSPNTVPNGDTPPRRDSTSSTPNGSSTPKTPVAPRFPPRIPGRSKHDPLPPLPPGVNGNDPTEDWEAPSDEATPAATALAANCTKVFGDKDPEEIYGQVRRNEAASFILRREQIMLQDETLGTGNFGSVKRGRCLMQDGSEIPVAVKTLKKEDISDGQQPEIVKEAQVMQQLDHRNIVRLIGICQADSFMLVMELAPIGPLHKYVQKHKDTPVWNILELMYQVAQGMQYLESKRFVHRDLAARNVLMVTSHFAKVSDFGMSKTLGVHHEYYKARNVGKWPLKWYAPECMYYFKFDSKSDVWSFGVTLWEALSYGEKPYKKMRGEQLLMFLHSGNRLPQPNACDINIYEKMRGEQLLMFLHSGNRLPQPNACDDQIYDAMLRCWVWEKTDRLSFTELVPIMLELFEKHKYGSASGISI